MVMLGILAGVASACSAPTDEGDGAGAAGADHELNGSPVDDSFGQAGWLVGTDEVLRLMPSEEGLAFTAGAYAFRRALPSGELDSTFVEETKPSVLWAKHGVALPSGKFVLGSGDLLRDGVFQLERRAEDGRRDSTFAGPTSTLDMATAMISAGADALLVVGTKDLQLAVEKISATGSRDPSFGTDGIATTADSKNLRATSIALAGDRSMFVGGYEIAAKAGDPFDPVVVRLTSKGTIDTTFGGVRRVPELVLGPRVMTVDEKGSVLMLSEEGRRLVRVKRDGTVDTTFGEAGVVQLSKETPACRDHLCEGVALALQSDGKIVLVVNGDVYPEKAAFVTRLNDDGSFDEAFGQKGWVGPLQLMPDGRGSSAADEALLVTGTRIYVGGTAKTKNNETRGGIVALRR